jgi:hypothetical protein
MHWTTAVSAYSSHSRRDWSAGVASLQVTLIARGVGVTDERCTDSASHLPCKRRSVEGVDNRAEVREFLTSRRAKITPAQAGLPRSVSGESRGCAAVRWLP